MELQEQVHAIMEGIWKEYKNEIGSITVCGHSLQLFTCEACHVHDQIALMYMYRLQIAQDWALSEATCLPKKK